MRKGKESPRKKRVGEQEGEKGRREQGRRGEGKMVKGSVVEPEPEPEP